MQNHAPTNLRVAAWDRKRTLINLAPPRQFEPVLHPRETPCEIPCETPSPLAGRLAGHLQKHKLSLVSREGAEMPGVWPRPLSILSSRITSQIC